MLIDGGSLDEAAPEAPMTRPPPLRPPERSMPLLYFGVCAPREVQEVASSLDPGGRMGGAPLRVWCKWSGKGAREKLRNVAGCKPNWNRASRACPRQLVPGWSHSAPSMSTRVSVSAPRELDAPHNDLASMVSVPTCVAASRCPLATSTKLVDVARRESRAWTSPRAGLGHRLSCQMRRLVSVSGGRSGTIVVELHQVCLTLDSANQARPPATAAQPGVDVMGQG